MRYYWDLIRHFFTSNSRHGTHSPFVYDLAVHAIYARSDADKQQVDVPEGFKPSYMRLLLRILSRMEKKKIAYVQQPMDADTLWVDLKQIPLPSIIEAVRRGKLVVVHEPMRTRQSKRIWEKLIQSPDVIVSIHLFHFGLVMYRQGQRKENFRLRYPFWR